ncbi:MAG: hypothetical protein PHE48_00580 [Candidatus Daviesbacteria bacterium]|nr:hypothetical protein [Candidatus Daviesbacteria bacterium]
MANIAVETRIEFGIDPTSVAPGCVTTAPVEVWRYHTPLARSTDGGVYYLHRLAENLHGRYIGGFEAYERLVKRGIKRDSKDGLDEYVREVGRAFVKWQGISDDSIGLTDSSKAACVLGLAAEVVDPDGTPTIRYLNRSIGVWSRLKPEDTALEYNKITHNWEPVAIE